MPSEPQAVPRPPIQQRLLWGRSGGGRVRKNEIVRRGQRRTTAERTASDAAVVLLADHAVHHVCGAWQRRMAWPPGLVLEKRRAGVVVGYI